MRADGQKPHTRLSPRVSEHHITKPIGSGGRVNAAVVHGKFTFLSGEICATCDRIIMRKSGTGQPGKQGPGIFVAVGGDESLHGKHKPDSISWRIPIALCMETCWVSAQKSADGIVVHFVDEGQNAERRKGIP